MKTDLKKEKKEFLVKIFEKKRLMKKDLKKNEFLMKKISTLFTLVII